MGVEFDLVEAASNLRKHGVTFEEAASALLDPMALVKEDLDSVSEARWTLLGMSSLARLLMVVYTLRRDDSVRLISARRASRSEEKHYA
ncbi:MAG: BrnT family toxin [Chromatiales bacterium]|jgi:uncharacterized protein|nr:BrnT family toxin [Chromatiales bacterium]